MRVGPNASGFFALIEISGLLSPGYKYRLNAQIWEIAHTHP